MHGRVQSVNPPEYDLPVVIEAEQHMLPFVVLHAPAEMEKEEVEPPPKPKPEDKQLALF